MTVFLIRLMRFLFQRVFLGKTFAQYLFAVPNLDIVYNCILFVQVMQHFMLEMDSQLTEDKLYRTLRKEVCRKMNQHDICTS